MNNGVVNNDGCNLGSTGGWKQYPVPPNELMMEQLNQVIVYFFAAILIHYNANDIVFLLVVMTDDDC
jgi:hypothetical protein